MPKPLKDGPLFICFTSFISYYEAAHWVIQCTTLFPAPLLTGNIEEWPMPNFPTLWLYSAL